MRRCLVHAMYLSTSVVAVSSWGAITSARRLPFNLYIGMCGWYLFCSVRVGPKVNDNERIDEARALLIVLLTIYLYIICICCCSLKLYWCLRYLS